VGEVFFPIKPEMLPIWL